MQEVQEVQEEKTSADDGLRTRKRAKTLALIHEAAMKLFFKRGFEATTLDDIAEAAEVSRRSLFHYFKSKEEIVFSTKGDIPNLVAEAVSRRPRNEPLLDMVEKALSEMAAGYQSPETRQLARLIRDTPALRAGDQAEWEKVEKALAKALAIRKKLPETDMKCRVTAASAIGIMKLAVEAWLAGGDAGPEVHGKAGFTALRRVLD